MKKIAGYLLFVAVLYIGCCGSAVGSMSSLWYLGEGQVDWEKLWYSYCIFNYLFAFLLGVLMGLFFALKLLYYLTDKPTKDSGDYWYREW